MAIIKCAIKKIIKHFYLNVLIIDINQIIPT